MLASGLVDVQSHTFWHPDFQKERARQNPEKYQAFVDDQLARSKSILESRLGIKVDLLAWPFGIVDQGARRTRRGPAMSLPSDTKAALRRRAKTFSHCRASPCPMRRGAQAQGLLTANPAGKPIP